MGEIEYRRRVTVGDIEYRYRRIGNTGVYGVQEEREHWGILRTRVTGTVVDVEYRRNGNIWGYEVQEEQERKQLGIWTKKS